jgi:hypothetical protein
MTKLTHKTAAAGAGIAAAYAVYHTNLFNCGISPYIGVFLVTQAARVGGVYPDVDVAWENVPDKTPEKKVINTILRIAGDGHRSRTTHSLDITALLIFAVAVLPKIVGLEGLQHFISSAPPILAPLALIARLLNLLLTSEASRDVIFLAAIGFVSGWASHMFMDMLTMEGVRLSCLGNRKVRFVPKKLFGFKFSTGEAWEDFVRAAATKINCALWAFYFAPFAVFWAIDKLTSR